MPGIRPYRAENFYECLKENKGRETSGRKKKMKTKKLSKKADSRAKNISVKNKQRGGKKLIAEKKK